MSHITCDKRLRRAGFFGKIEGSEVLYGVFESLPVIIAILTYTAFPPSKFASFAKDVSPVGSFDTQGEPKVRRSTFLTR